MRQTKGLTLITTIIILTIAAMLITACGTPIRPAPVLPTAEVIISTQLTSADTAQGAQLFSAEQCVTCHGTQAEGAIGPTLARTDLSFEEFIVKVRTAIPPKPAYSAEALSDQGVYDIFGWLQDLSTQVAAQPAAPFAVIKVEPGQEILPEGLILGMSLWTGFGCDSCHGAFAQGSSDGPELAGISYPYELERANMRKTADTIPEHDQSYMRDTVLKRLYQWLLKGANPGDGC